jgi:hypothetical protein
MRCFPSVRFVTLREVYVRYGAARKATVFREQLEDIEPLLIAVASQLDAAIADGEGSPRWTPSPGHHCAICLRPADCPISREVRQGGGAIDERTAQQYAKEWVVAKKVRDERTTALKAYVDAHGPVIVEGPKKTFAVGWVPNSNGNGRAFRAYEPKATEFRAEPEPDLEAALRASLEDS